MKLHTQAVSDRQEELLYMDKSNGTKSRKPTSETKPAKGKRKGNLVPENILAYAKFLPPLILQ